MSILTPDQIARYALGAGFGIQDGTVATAIAIAESGGDPQAHATKGEDSRGLWQINVQAHPEYGSQDLYDPATNAKIAFTIYKAQGWRPWTTYTSGKYLLVMPAATAGMAVGKVAGPLVDPIDNAVGGALGGVKDAASSAQAAVGFLQDLENPQTWQRVLKVGVGALMILVGIRLLLEKASAPVVKKAASVAKVVAK